LVQVISLKRCLPSHFRRTSRGWSSCACYLSLLGADAARSGRWRHKTFRRDALDTCFLQLSVCSRDIGRLEEAGCQRLTSSVCQAHRGLEGPGSESSLMTLCFVLVQGAAGGSAKADSWQVRPRAFKLAGSSSGIAAGISFTLQKNRLATDGRSAMCWSIISKAMRRKPLSSCPCEWLPGASEGDNGGRGLEERMDRGEYLCLKRALGYIWKLMQGDGLRAEGTSYRRAVSFSD